MSEGSNIDVSKLCVSKVPFFNHLDDEEKRKIVDMSMHRNFKRGENIYREGDPLEYLYIVHQGRVKIHQLYASGKEQLLRILEPGEFMGELALFTEKKLDSFAEALENTEICMINRSDMQNLMQQYPTIALKILEQFTNRLDKTEKLLGDLSSKDVEARIAGYLLELAEEKGEAEIILPISKKDLASYLGTTQETISRRLADMQMDHVIEQKGHRNIKIIDRDTLFELAGSEV